MEIFQLEVMHMYEIPVEGNIFTEPVEIPVTGSVICE